MQQIEYLSLVFSVPLECEDALQGYFLINHDPKGFEEEPGGAFVVHIMKEEWTEAASERLLGFLDTLAPAAVTLDEIRTHQNIDWNAEWESGIEPLKVTDDLTIAPSWRLIEAAAMHPKYLIVIDPKMSFGTGHHETTRLCLKMTEQLDCTGKTVLDLGSGTGILAMYAVMRGGTHAVAVDTDEWAFENARENCLLNGFHPSVIELRHGNIASVVKSEEQFEIVFANIHRNILLAICREIAAHQSSGGMLVLSGLLEYDASEVIAAYKVSGYALVEQLQENEWICLRFERMK